MVNNERGETRQERREKRLRKQREQIKQHGKNIAKIYRDVVLKKVRGEKGRG